MRCNLRFCLLVLFLALLSGSAAAGPLYWVYLVNKDTAGYRPEKHLSTATLQHRLLTGTPIRQYSDIPVNHLYVQQAEAAGAKTRICSKWLNAFSTELNPEQLQALKALPFVAAIEPFTTRFAPAAAGEMTEVAEKGYSMALSQINAPFFDKKKLHGEGIIMGLIDAGFRDADKTAALHGVFAADRLRGTRDYVSPAPRNFYRNPDGHLDTHGTTVLKHIAGQDSSQSLKQGCATQALFFLARTDDAVHEFRGEEDYWVAALEYMDSSGVRIINTSLGYALNFDKPEENYKPSEMDGKSSVVVRAANKAVYEKDILVVVSAGNDGGRPDWGIVCTPADGQGPLSVGATYGAPWPKADYSGIGPAELPFLKPDLACYSLSGTSFSAPVISGFAACVLQSNPKLNALQLKRVLQKSGNLYPFGNNYIGYGWPDAETALNLARDTADSPKGPKVLYAQNLNTEPDGSLKLKVRVADEKEVILYHKKNSRIVTDEQTAELKGNYIFIKRPADTAQTTIMNGEKVWELFWEGKE